MAERKRLATALAEKNEELESVLYAASHDLRSPLLNLQGFGRELAETHRELTSLLDKHPPDPAVADQVGRLLREDTAQALRYIESSAGKMDSLLSGLLRVSRVGQFELRPAPMDMNQVLRRVLDSMRHQIDTQGVDVRLDELPGCVGDEGKIGQVFDNLVGNAIKYRRPDRPCRIEITGDRKSVV